MRVAVFGAGAIGGHLALRLARGRARVTAIARGPQLAAFRAHGVRVDALDGSHHAAIRAEADPTLAGEQDAVLITAKTPGLPALVPLLDPLLGPDTAVVFVQNGIPWWYPLSDPGPLADRSPPWIDPGGAIRARIGTDRAIAGVVYSACTVVEPGRIQVVSPNNRLFLGRPDDLPDPRIDQIAALLEAGGMHGSRAPRIREAVWTKLLGNLTQGPLSVLTTAPLGAILDVPALRATVLACIAEAKAIAAAAGVQVEIDAAQRISRAGGGPHRASIAQDLLAGRPMEIASLFDAPLWMARELGVPTPTLDVTVGLARLRAIEAGLYAPPGG